MYICIEDKRRFVVHFHNFLGVNGSRNVHKCCHALSAVSVAVLFVYAAINYCACLLSLLYLSLLYFSD